MNVRMSTSSLPRLMFSLLLSGVFPIAVSRYALAAPAKKTPAPQNVPVKVPESALKKPATPAAAPATAVPAASPTSASSVLDAMNMGGKDFDLSKEPTNISADSLTLLNDKRTFTYEGKVVVTQGDMTLMSDFLDGSYSDKNEIQKITARQNVEITKGLDMKAHGQRAEYDALSRTIVLTETPSVEQNGSVLSADIIRIFVDENRSVAEGNVKVTLKNTGDGLKSVKEGAK